MQQTPEKLGIVTTAHNEARGEGAREIKRNAGVKARRWVVERTHSWMNRCRGIRIRWWKGAQHSIAVQHVALAIITCRPAQTQGY